MKGKAWQSTLAAAWLPLLALGCIEYTVETQLNIDGSGVRREEMVVDRTGSDDFPMSQDAFRRLMHVTAEAGWRHTREERGNDEVDVFRRQTRLMDPSSWGELSGTIRMSGALARGVGPGSGVPRYSDIMFSNTVRVDSRHEPQGRIYSYREVFYWENLAGAIVDRQVAQFASEIERRYPKLGAESRGELFGYLKAGVWEALARGYFDLTESELIRESEPLLSRMTDQAVKVVRPRYSDVDRRFFADLLRRMIVEGGDEEALDAFITNQVPGVRLAWNTELVVRLTMPGEVTESNAHERDGSTVTWKFGPLDALSAPVSLVAESQVPSLGSR